MSKFDWKKDIKQSLIDASLITTAIYGLAWLGSKAGVAKPTLSFTAENALKVYGYAVVADVALDYAKNEKWIPT